MCHPFRSLSSDLHVRYGALKDGKPKLGYYNLVHTLKCDFWTVYHGSEIESWNNVCYSIYTCILEPLGERNKILKYNVMYFYFIHKYCR